MIKKEAYLFVGLIFLMLIIPLSSAGIFDDLYNKITGKATSDETALTITVGNTAPNIIGIESIGAQTPAIGANLTVEFIYEVHDPDGNDDIDNSTARMNFSKTGSPTVTNASCVVINATNASHMYYNCQGQMTYFSSQGTWTVNVMINDSASPPNEDVDATTSFTYNSLNAMSINVTSLTWPTLGIASTNSEANEEEYVSNLGNEPQWTSVTAKHLLGYTDASRILYADHFQVDDVSVACTSGTALVNASSTNITVAAAVTPSDGAFGIRYFCLAQIFSNVTDQDYNTTAYGTWTIATTIS